MNRGAFDPDCVSWLGLVAQLRMDHDAHAEGRRALRLFPEDVDALMDANARCLAALQAVTSGAYD